MSWILILAYLFFIGSVLGWVIELFFRRFISRANPERKWINPGFCIGPYLPMYGSGLCVLYLIAKVGSLVNADSVIGKIVIVIIMGICMTVIEYISGIICLKLLHVRLWDYRKEFGNLQGIICPKFSVIWAAAGALYYFLIHPYILDALAWLSNNLAFSFVIGFFFGVLTIDAVYSSHMLVKIKKFAEENNVIVRYENLKIQIKKAQEKAKEKTHFIFSFSSVHPLVEHLKAAQNEMEIRIRERRNKKK